MNFRVEYGDHVRIGFEMVPPLGMLPNPRRINRVLSLLGVVINTYFLYFPISTFFPLEEVKSVVV